VTEEEYKTVKIASFRITKGLWTEFCDKAESQRLTATDVLKMAIERFLSGELDMSSYKGTPPPQLSQVAPDEDVRSLVDTAVSKMCLPLVARIEAIEQRLEATKADYLALEKPDGTTTKS
jgi:hypothetical protein